MSTPRLAAAAALAGFVLVGGCGPGRTEVLENPEALAGAVPQPARATAAAPDTQDLTDLHPFPRGDEWPLAPDARFELGQVLHVRVQSFDGVELAGVLLLPALPAGVRAPVVLWSSPYFGSLDPPIDEQYAGVPALRGEVVPLRELIARGYAVAGFNVRGTGGSGGCFELVGRREQQDQAVLVEWLARQPWSSGRVGMIGQSYDAITPLAAAVQAPRPLKAIVTMGIAPDVYQSFITPQGAHFDDQGVGLPYFYLPANSAPQRGSVEALLASLAVRPERVCPELAAFLASEPRNMATDVRDAAFYAERRLSDRFSEVRAAVMVSHGFQEHLAYSDDLIFGMLTRAPRTQLSGQYGHMVPPLADWKERVLAWFDYWLKGLGRRPGTVGQVEYQDTAGTWHLSGSWPPAEARPEVLYLSREGLRPSRGGPPAALQARPGPATTTVSVDGRTAPAHGPTPFCPLETALTPPAELLLETAPLAEQVLLAGNPMGYLRLTSDAVGGVLSVQLFALGPDFRCGEGTPSDFRFLTEGAVDLRFHQGNMEGQDFPTHTPVGVRIDFQSVAAVLRPGERLAAFVSAGSAKASLLRPYAPLLSLGTDGSAAASHLVLPLVQGSLGGARPTLHYPPRPFAEPSR